VSVCPFMSVLVIGSILDRRGAYKTRPPSAGLLLGTCASCSFSPLLLGGLSLPSPLFCDRRLADAAGGERIVLAAAAMRAAGMSGAGCWGGGLAADAASHMRPPSSSADAGTAPGR
jgi:hypothetical protein